MEITQEMIDNAIKNCIWRMKVHDVYICRGVLAPCSKVLNNGKCDTLRELFRGENGNDD